MRRFVATLSLVCSALCIACSGGSSYSAGRTTVPSASPVPTVTFARTTLHIAGPDARAIDVEIATTPAQTERGLGYRDALAAKAGMLFDLHTTRVPSFWMKGMRFALDMVWIGEDRRVVAVTADIPPDPAAPDAQLRRYAPAVPVRYVLELNAGAATALGIGEGAQLAFTLP